MWKLLTLFLLVQLVFKTEIVVGVSQLVNLIQNSSENFNLRSAV